MRKLSAAIALLLITSIFTPAIAAAPKPGTTCKTLNQKITSGGQVYTCIKSGSKKVWSKGVKVAPKPAVTASPTPTVSPTPTPTSGNCSPTRRTDVVIDTTGRPQTMARSSARPTPTLPAERSSPARECPSPTIAYWPHRDHGHGSSTA